MHLFYMIELNVNRGTQFSKFIIPFCSINGQSCIPSAFALHTCLDIWNFMKIGNSLYHLFRGDYTANTVDSRN
jgi:hypothetical protein